MRTKAPHCKASPACFAKASGTVCLLGVQVPACAAHMALARVAIREALKAPTIVSQPAPLAALPAKEPAHA